MKGKKIMRTVALLLFASVLFTACGKAEEAAGKDNYVFSDGNIEEDEGSQKESEENMSGSESESSLAEESTEASDESQEVTQQEDVPAVVQTKEPVPNNTKEIQNAGNTEKSNNSQPAASANITGIVDTLGTNGFQIKQVQTSKGKDGSDLAVTSSDNVVLIQVNYTDNTEFVVCTTTDGGKTSSESAGTKNDLKSGKTVILDGSWNGSVLDATKVLIYNFG